MEPPSPGLCVFSMLWIEASWFNLPKKSIKKDSFTQDTEAIRETIKQMKKNLQ